MLVRQSLLAIVAMALSISTLYAEDKTNDAELISYTAQKYHADFNAQNDKAKLDITNEYLQNVKLSDALLAGTMKDDVDYHVASHLLTIEIWAKKFMQNAQVSDEALQELYKQVKPKTIPAYRLRNILYKTDAEAEKGMKLLSAIKDKSKQLTKFKTLVKSESKDFLSAKNEGEIGFVELNKVDPTLQSILKEKKVGDIFKVAIDKVGFQVLMLEEIKPEREATFDEAKTTLNSMARQELLKKEMQKILGNKGN